MTIIMRCYKEPGHLVLMLHDVLLSTVLNCTSQTFICMKLLIIIDIS